jgi:TonB family protein
VRSHPVPLAQFMPYGAPELLESSRPHLTRALLLSSTIGVALFLAMLGAAASGWFAGRAGAPLVPSVTIFEFPPDVLQPIPRPPSVAPSVPSAPATASGPPIAVPDARADVLDDTFVMPSDPAPVADDGGSTHPCLGCVPLPDVATPPPARLFEATEVDEQPVSMHPLSASYPDLAREAGVEGLVVVRVLVGPDGRVHDAVVVKSVPMLDAAALEAARRATFQPALLNNRPVSCWVAVPFRFRLR